MTPKRRLLTLIFKWRLFTLLDLSCLFFKDLKCFSQHVQLSNLRNITRISGSSYRPHVFYQNLYPHPRVLIPYPGTLYSILRNPGPVFSIYFSVWRKHIVGENSGLFLKGDKIMGTFVFIPQSRCQGFSFWNGAGPNIRYLFMTAAAGTVAQNIIYEGLLLMVLLIMMKCIFF